LTYAPADGLDTKMKELITYDQANKLILIATVVIPIVGLVYGVVAKRLKTGIAWGLIVGIGNLIMWKVYNAITDSLGLDTVKNLLVNLGLFISIGLVGGFLAAMAGRRKKSQDDSSSGGSGGVESALVGGLAPRSPGAARTVEDSKQPPRDGG